MKKIINEKDELANAGYREPTVEEQFGNGQPNRMIVTLPMVGKDQDVFEKRPEKRPDHYPEQLKKQEIINRNFRLLRNTCTAK